MLEFIYKLGFLEALEFIGMIATMTGAYLVTRNTHKKMFYGGVAFLIANYVMFAFAGGKGMIPLQIQMLAFFVSTVPILKAYANDWKSVRKNIFLISIIYIGGLILFFEFNFSNINITELEIIAAVIAVSGSFMLKYKETDKKITSFILFFIADVLYVYVSVDKGLLFFGIQSLFFWYTSIDGIRKELKHNEDRFLSFIERQKPRIFISSKSF